MASTPYTDVVLITGANQGIGFETAKKLATEHSDYHVIMTGRRKAAIEEAVAKLQASGLTNVEALVLDVTSNESITAAVKEVEAKHGRLDVLINNAGISVAWDEIATRERWLELYNTNVVGVEFVTNAFIPLLEKSNGVQRIVNVTSILGSMQYKLDKEHYIHKIEWPPYSVTKSALNQLTLHYVSRYPTWKINLTCPGYLSTNLNAFKGYGPASDGAINTCRLATLGADGETGTWTDKEGPMKW